MLALAPHLEVEAERLRADATDVDRDFKKVVEVRGTSEVAFEVRARQPDVQFVEHDAVWQADGAEQFGLGELEEAYVSAVKNYARGVNVAPADALLDAELPCFAHVGCFLHEGRSRKTFKASARKIKST